MDAFLFSLLKRGTTFYLLKLLEDSVGTLVWVCQSPAECVCISQRMPEGEQKLAKILRAFMWFLGLTFCPWLFSSTLGIVTHYKH